MQKSGTIIELSESKGTHKKATTTIQWPNQPILKTKEYIVLSENDTILFLPTDPTWDHMIACYEVAYKWGYGWIHDNTFPAFKIEQTVGNTDQTGQIDYPVIKLIKLIPQNIP